MADHKEGSEKVTDQNEDDSSSPKPTFENGQLSYLGFDVETIPQTIIQDYCNITSRLDLSFNRLRSAQGLEHFKYLKELVLDNNELDDRAVFPHLRELHTLTLNKNRLTDLQGLLEQLVSKFPNLTYLSLLGNEACPNQLVSSEKDDEDYQRYRYYVIYKIPKLKFLDSSQVTVAETNEAKRVGPYMLVVKPKSLEEEQESELSSSSNSPRGQYTPLPDENVEHNSDHQGTYGKSKYIYYGRHSEGNRFIRNKDL